MNTLSRISSTADQVAQRLRLAIHAGELAPGQSLLQEVLAEQYGVSRIPIREAMKQLESEGLLDIVPNKGTTVSKPSTDDIAELYEIRSVLECFALRLSMQALTKAQLERAEVLLKQLDVETDPQRWADLDWAFHQALYAGVSKPRLHELMSRLRNNSHRFYFLGQGKGEHLANCQKSHRSLWLSVKSGDTDKAVTQLAKHLAEAGKAVAKEA